MVSNQQKLIVIFGLKKEYDIFSPTKNFQKGYGFGKKALKSLKKFNLSEIDTVINIGYCGAIDSSVKSGDIIKIKNIVDEKGIKLKCIRRNRNNVMKKIEEFNLKELDLITTLKVKNLKEKIELKKKYSNVSLVDIEAFHLLEELLLLYLAMLFLSLFFTLAKRETYTPLKNKGELFTSKNPKLLIELIRMSTAYFICKRRLKYLFTKIF